MNTTTLTHAIQQIRENISDLAYMMDNGPADEISNETAADFIKSASEIALLIDSEIRALTPQHITNEWQ